MARDRFVAQRVVGLATTRVAEDGDDGNRVIGITRGARPLPSTA
jgi:hypothetical protein